MEPNESQQQQQQHQHLSSPFYHQHHNHPTASSDNAAPSPTNGMLPPNDGSRVVYPHSVPSSAAVTVPLEPAKRRRGRPRKYGTPEQALAAKRMASSSSVSSARGRRESTTSCYSGSSRKSQLALLGNTGQGFTPHIINVAAGEDVSQKIMLFMQQSKHELCILSASGTISNASLRQPATSGGNITYEGQFEILSLSGSYVRTELGGRTGGLSICLSSTDGQIIGGGLGGPLKAAGPVQVIVSTFQIDTKKAGNSGAKGDASGSNSRLPSPVGATSMLGVCGFRSGMEASGRNPVRGNDEHDQNMGDDHFMLQPPHMIRSRPSEWGGGPDGRSIAGYDLAGRIRHQSSENGDYGEQMHD